MIKRVLAGEREAFEILVLKYQKMIFNLARSKLSNREDALDVSQECFLRAYRKLASFRAGSTFSTWLYRICLNLIYDRYRKNSGKAEEPLEELPRRAAEIPDGSADPQDIALKNERSAAVKRAIEALPEDFREILVLRDMNGCSYSQISELLGLGEGTVKSRINRARLKLRELLKRDKEHFDFREV